MSDPDNLAKVRAHLQLYDALHDYFIEMFIRTPQDRKVPRGASSGAEER